MAAEALAHVLISHGTCRMAWAEQGKFPSLFDLMRCAVFPSLLPSITEREVEEFS